jgi:uncharacterized membrane protein YgcG
MLPVMVHATVLKESIKKVQNCERWILLLRWNWIGMGLLFSWVLVHTGTGTSYQIPLGRDHTRHPIIQSAPPSTISEEQDSRLIILSQITVTSLIGFLMVGLFKAISEMKATRLEMARTVRKRRQGDAANSTNNHDSEWSGGGGGGDGSGGQGTSNNQGIGDDESDSNNESDGIASCRI